VRADDKVRVEELVASDANLNESDFVLGTPLQIAALEGHKDIARILIAHGADLEVPSELNGARALHLAAQFGVAETAALLVDAGADIEAGDNDQRTPLHLAAWEGQLEVVRLLLDRGAPIDKREGRYDFTPLHEAAHHGQLDVVRLLLDRGADIRAVDHSGMSAFALAATPKSFSVVGGPELLDYLAQNGSDILVYDNTGISVLANAERRLKSGFSDYREVIDALQRLGAPP